MKATSERIEGCQVELNVEVEPEEMEKALQRAYRSLVNKVIVPGFRKGKAPRDILERHVGRESLVSEALDRLVPELYEQALDEQEIDAIGQPQMEMTQVDPPIFKAVVPVRPVVELGDYHSVEASPESVEITDENVQSALDNLRRLYASFEPVERDARYGDMVALDVTGEVEGETVLNTKGSMYRITEGSVMPVPGFSDQLVGMSIGEEKEFSLPFPEDHSHKEIAGKDCLFKVSISEVKEENLPEMNDEFVESLEEDIKTVAQLRERMEDNLRAAAEQDARAKLENQVIEEAVGLSKVEFPTVLLDQEVNRMINEQLMRTGGMNLETYLGYRGLTEEDFRGELRPIAERKVASSLVLNKVYEAENIEVADSEIDAEVDRMLEKAGERSEQMKQFFSTPQARDSLRGELLTRKTIDRLVQIATGEYAVEDTSSGEESDTSVDEVVGEKEEGNDDSA